MDKDTRAFLEAISGDRTQLCEVLDSLGERFLSKSFSKVQAVSKGRIGPILVRYDGATWGEIPLYPQKFGAIFFFGLNELEDGTVTDDQTRVWNTPREDVEDEADIVPAAKRLLERIFRHLPRLRTRVRMLLEIRGFDAGWI